MSKSNIKDFSRALSVSVNCCSVYRGREWQVLTPSVPFWRVYVHLKNCGQIDIPEASYPLRKGRVTLIAPYTEFVLHPSGTPMHFFTHAVVGYPYTLLRGRIFQFRAKDQVSSFVDRIMGEIPVGQERAILHAKPHRYLSAIQLVSMLMQEIPDEHLLLPDARIAQLDAFMRENISRRFPNDDLAEMVGMSTSGFIRFFREKTGVTPARYFHEIRTEQITNLLENTKWSIDKIAESCGFSERYHMSKVFKRTTGSSPAAWRRSSAENRLIL